MNDLGPGQNLLTVLVTRSSKRAPMARIYIAVVHGHVGFIKAVHTQHTEELAVCGRVGPQSHQGIGYRIVQLARQAREQFTTLPCTTPPRRRSPVAWPRAAISPPS